MPINRKLQSEMDRTLKRVADGQAAFEELWLKLDAMEVICTLQMLSRSIKRHMSTVLQLTLLRKRCCRQPS